MPQTKKQQRRLALAHRDALAQDLRAYASRWLAVYADEVLALAPRTQMSRSQIIAGFWPIRSEIDPRPLMFALSAGGVQLALPAFIDEERDRRMIFREFMPGDRLVGMGFDTLGPSQEASPLDPDIVLLPLAAFDGRGNRIGYGGGFYDRALAAMHGRGLFPKLIGLGFNCQEVDGIAAQTHDIRLEALLSESGLRLFEKD